MLLAGFFECLLSGLNGRGTLEWPVDPSNTLTLPILTVPSDFVSEQNFLHIWTFGKPFIATGCLVKANLSWSPQYFIDQYGGQLCSIEDCMTGKSMHTTVRSFFEWFGKPSEEWPCLKLKVLSSFICSYHLTLDFAKDWPPTQEFSRAFPELYEDFCHILPAPVFTRRDGFMNVSAHFPMYAIPPDLGRAFSLKIPNFAYPALIRPQDVQCVRII